MKSYLPQDSTSENELSSQNNFKQTVKSARYKQSDTNVAQSRTKRDIKPPNKLDF